MAIRLDAATSEAIRLQAIADDQKERLGALRSRAEAAADAGCPGPTVADLQHATKVWRATQAAADGARRHARGDRPRGRRRAA